ncbi:root hair defective 3 GTP-binding protein [Ascodesmis nigricans]|uniref:Root hair defective 3 GTP-binding protein n=1 Tax=Ascodesmis nigricans TaxID=341454 RepID=A0A4S2N6X5_9PEZI|nr:root hair defective 3 GTP-binding protein [Ascodesmis nigricans]
MKDVTPEELAQYSHGIQIIDENKDFTQKLPVYLQVQKLLTVGFNYHVVAVFGSQSTGKSTLLNHLFGTQFDVMDEAARRQTTKGIWMARAKEDSKDHGKNILVMDVEGTDGRERGEDQDFERKSALFALATSEVLIVNIWEHQVGLYQGANMGLLKTVFEVNLGLFLKDRNTTHRSLLFFVIRDHIGHTPLKNLQNTLLADLNRIWDSLTKPPGLEGSKIDDFFDFQFTTLPHKLLQPDKFITEAHQLRKRFTEGIPPGVESLTANGVESTKDGVFLPGYHRRIPADGFPMYAESIWEQIVTNKDLDLPSQQELLAQFRCDEIAANCTAVFNETITPFEKQAQSGKVLEGLGPAMKQALSTAVESFEESGGRYHKGVFQRKRDDLRHALETRLRSLVVGQLSALSKRSVGEFTEEVTGILKKANASNASAAYDFAKIVEEAKANAVSRFKEEADSCFIPGETTTWSSHDDELELLEKDIDAIASRLRGEEMKRLVIRLEKTIKTKLTEPVELEFKRMDSTLWDRIWKAWTLTIEDAVQQFETKSRSFNATDTEREVGVWRLKKRGWAVLKAKIDEEVLEGNLLLKLRENFEDNFRYDEHGVPRVWKPTDDIEGAYTRARESTLTLIPRVSTFKLSSSDSPPDLDSFLGATPVDASDDSDAHLNHEDDFEILSEAKQHDMTQRFKRMADAVFVEAKRSAIGGVAQVPYWIYVVMLGLGWNEIMAVIRSPVYFVFLILCGFGAYIVYTLNLWGPIYRVSNAMIEQGVEVGKERLREILEVGDKRQEAPIAMQSLDSQGRRRTARSIKDEDED